MIVIINEIINSYFHLNTICANNVGDTARTLANRTRYYKNIINKYDKTNPDDSFYMELINLHTKLVEVEATKEDRNHMIYDSLSFVERLINKRMKKEFL